MKLNEKRATRAGKDEGARHDAASPELHGNRLVGVAILLFGLVVLMSMAWSSQRWSAALRDTARVEEHLARLRLFIVRTQAFSDRLAQVDPPMPPGQLSSSFEAVLESARAIEGADGVEVVPVARWRSAALAEGTLQYRRVLDQLLRRVRAWAGGEVRVVELNLLLGLAHDSAGRVERQMVAEIDAARREQRLLDLFNLLTLLALMAAAFVLSRRVELRRRAAVEGLLASQQRLRLHGIALDGTRDGVLVTAPDVRVVAVNRAFSVITGYAEDEVLGRIPRMFRPGRQDAASLHAMWETVARQGYWQGELWTLRKDGEVLPLSMSISAVTEDRDAGGEAGTRGELRFYVGVFTDLSPLRRSEERASRLALYDPLTELPNRQRVGEWLGEAIAAADADGGQVTVLFIDLDRFGHINDALGHERGDELIAAAARRLRACVGEGVMLARHGSDEFVAVATGRDAEREAEALAARVLDALHEAFELRPGQRLHLTASIGVSVHPGDGVIAAELIQRAEAAMYDAKRAGRNLVRFYRQSLTERAGARLALESRLRRALAADGFSMHYQPIVDMRSGRVVGAEALVRLKDADGPAAPSEFIPILEDSDLIVELGDWVRREVCRQGRRWLDEGRSFDLLAVNMSPEEIRRGGLVERLTGVLAETGFPPGRLELEITESSLIAHAEETLAMFRAISALDVGLSIDDFGTGYSSLSYLKRFPVNKLKIDASFVHDLPHDPNDVQLTATIIELGRSLGLKVLAEGVEKPVQRHFLAAQGCDYYQGHLCSPPLPGEEFARRFLPPAEGER
ncbi:putative bifunctional diguanylate cyclase/phosphodiesterase [Thauera phenolivorans]|uniref:putative bifunctional diguanylate cyclase/phosphodiesterase n=1 Tax=Thauera phenolivorans TaxID=1792543 RepID=UPI00083B2426|nr:GGDEF domain-containing phosphodiesterase [Thauera phenolivorans]